MLFSSFLSIYVFILNFSYQLGLLTVTEPLVNDQFN